MPRYLTGFLVPVDADEEQRADPTALEEVDAAGDDGGGADDAASPEPGTARIRFFPSSIGASVLVAPGVRRLSVRAQWGDYREERTDVALWRRNQRSVELSVALLDETSGPATLEVPESEGLELAVFFDPRALDADARDRANLHAKCVVVDGKHAFVSSANFTEAAQERNIEVGVLVRSDRFARRLEEHFLALIARQTFRAMP